jgi:hypothetical protein
MGLMLSNSQRVFKSYQRLTKRAPDVWDSAAFSSIFLASVFFLLSGIFPTRPHAGNANRSAATPKYWKAKNIMSLEQLAGT